MSPPNTGYDSSPTYMISQVAHLAVRNRFVGVLRPERGCSSFHPVLMGREVSELVIGRQEGLDLSLQDEWVSRRHARIRRIGDEFLLEDLQSSNGTYVDGVPIVSCVLRSGDWIQIGRNLFQFEVQLDNAAPVKDLTTWLD